MSRQEKFTRKAVDNYFGLVIFLIILCLHVYSTAKSAISVVRFYWQEKDL
jgi:hypothetical protein